MTAIKRPFPVPPGRFEIPNVGAEYTFPDGVTVSELLAVFDDIRADCGRVPHNAQIGELRLNAEAKTLTYTFDFGYHRNA